MKLHRLTQLFTICVVDKTENSCQARTQTFERRGGAIFKGFYKGGCESSENSDFETKISGVNSVSSEKLHDFEIICTARGVRSQPRTPTPCVRAYVLF